LTEGGVPLGELFTFLSGLYFRGKLAYARRFAQVEKGRDDVFVITATDGLSTPDRRVALDDLQRFAVASIDETDVGFTGPLTEDLRKLSADSPTAQFILLGSVATDKYVAPLSAVLGEQLRFPEQFIGMGDMSRGSVLLARAASGEELVYRTVSAGPRRGARRTSRGTLIAALTVAMGSTALGGCGQRETEPVQADLLPAAEAVQTGELPDTTFVRLVRGLSEPGGYFDTDNLISNERSYLHVTGALGTRGVRGGAYIGVGPDQNFSYMAVIQPELAFMVDIRHDNLLQHLWFKALFELAPSRIEYLALMFGRAPPEAPEEWLSASVHEIVDYVDGQPLEPARVERDWKRVRDRIRGTGLDLSDDELSTIESIYRRFTSAGLGLRFTSHNRPPQPYYPTYRNLLLESDISGELASYLVDEDRYQRLRRLQLENRVIPVVGDLAGGHALRAIGEEARRAGLAISGFYTSNVEFYLMGDGSFRRFHDNVASLPIDDRSVIIRSYFDRFRTSHPEAVRGYASVQLLHPIDAFIEVDESTQFRGYWDLVTRNSIPLR
jgi:hypothetical protein